MPTATQARRQEQWHVLSFSCRTLTPRWVSEPSQMATVCHVRVRGSRRVPAQPAGPFGPTTCIHGVETMGVEPTTSSLRTKRSAN